MSMSVLSKCWPLQMSPTMKSVLICLADYANERGICWPSVARICERTCLSKSTVLRAIRALETGAVLNARRQSGRSTVYQILLTGSGGDACAGGMTAPPEAGKRAAGFSVAPDSGMPLPETLQTEPQTRKNLHEFSGTHSDAVQHGLPEWLNPPLWQAFIQHRKTLRKPVTPQSAGLILQKLSELKEQNFDPNAALQESIAHGWSGVFAPRQVTTRQEKAGSAVPEAYINVHTVTRL